MDAMDRDVLVVQVQLVAASPDALDQARAALVAALGEGVRFPHPGRRGRRGQWLVYGELHINSRSARAEKPLSPPGGGAALIGKDG